MSLDVRDERMYDVVDQSAERETISTEFDFTEGPIWHPEAKHLTFSDIPANRIYRWSEADGVSIYRDPSHKANGNTYDRQGRILTCEHASSRVTREDGNGIEVIASHYNGKELNSPNDIVVRSDGAIFFTDPLYGRLDGPTGLHREQELDFQGVYMITPDGELTLLSSDFEMPNGLCLTLDEKELFVADTPRKHVRRFQIEGTTLTGGDVFCASPAPDGLKIDSHGYLYAGGPKGVGVYHPDGTWLGVFETPEFCANFTWGGEGLKTLFLTASTGLYRIPVNQAGIRLF